MATIAEMRNAINDKLDILALTYGESTTLDETSLNEVSYGVDDTNETVNPNLPPRPKE